MTTAAIRNEIDAINDRLNALRKQFGPLAPSLGEGKTLCRRLAVLERELAARTPVGDDDQPVKIFG